MKTAEFSCSLLKQKSIKRNLCREALVVGRKGYCWERSGETAFDQSPAKNQLCEQLFSAVWWLDKGCQGKKKKYWGPGRPVREWRKHSCVPRLWCSLQGLLNLCLNKSKFLLLQGKIQKLWEGAGSLTAAGRVPQYPSSPRQVGEVLLVKPCTTLLELRVSSGKSHSSKQTFG